MKTNTKPIRRTTGVEDVAVSMATRVGLLLSAVAIQSLLAYALLPAGRGAFAVCILFAAMLGTLLTPGGRCRCSVFRHGKKNECFARRVRLPCDLPPGRRTICGAGDPADPQRHRLLPEGRTGGHSIWHWLWSR